jgi:predicted HTH transcriptional regulator
MFIGVTNKGEVHGLSYDYSLANGKSNREFFYLEFEQMIEHFLSVSVKSNISGQFFEVDNKDVFLVTVLPSKHRPIFLNGQEGKEFFVRTETSSRHISDIEEIANYCIDTWTS